MMMKRSRKETRTENLTKQSIFDKDKRVSMCIPYRMRDMHPKPLAIILFLYK